MEAQMPAELFHSSISNVGARRRAALLPLSIAAHAVLLAAWFIVPLFADNELPDPPNRAMATYVEVKLPPPPAPPVHRDAVTRQAPVANQNAAPTEAPSKIVPERIPEAPESGFGTADGVPDGIFGSVTLPMESAPPPPPPPAQKVPVRPGGVIEEPRKLKYVAPIYPAIALAARREGTVVIDAIIGEDGRVKQATVLQSVALLDEAALTAVRQWVFTPTRLNGAPVPVVMTVTVTFRLQ
jgi:periplasmic protein TonB